jgi:hypothetical protein
MAMRSNKFARKFQVSGPARRRLERWDAGTNGAWLMIVLAGFVLILIAAILQIKAFFSLPESPPTQPTAQVQTIWYQRSLNFQFA